ncbi:hypothetical protein [Enorma burkinafasonensis]|uniref:hypothetical protein n=1 Tax=Enorma burkinafasonensis TaxID=2590867 RepID=UPI0011A8937B|nr:hypothetical protein [Enorma burkinafasonensis]
MCEKKSIQKPDELVLGLVPTDIEVKTDDALCIPFDRLPALGLGLSSLASALAPAVASAAAPVLFTVTDAVGNPIPPAVLQAFNDGSGLLGSFRDPIKGFGQARLHVAEAAQATAVVVDPVTLMMAATLMVVSQKLDSMQRAQEEMFEYLQQRDKAELRGALQALADIARDYRFNWSNDTFMQSSHAQVLEIRKQADAIATLQRAQIRGKLNGGPIEIRASVEARLSELVDHLAEYRLAVYTHALSSFLEPLLSRNNDAAYLRSVSERISAHGLAYRELYTECYNAVEEGARNSLDSAVLGGIADAGKALGGFLSQTPLGEATPVDEALKGAGEEIGKFNEGITDSLMAQLRSMSSPEVLPLQQGVESLASLREKPLAIAADSKALYLLPNE